MKFRRFAHILLCVVLFLCNFARFAAAEVIQAYRRPSDADLEWLLGETPAPNSFVSKILSESSPSNIIQTGHLVPSKDSSLIPHNGPCEPVKFPNRKLPRPTIPPAPKTFDNKLNTGLTPDEDGVVTIFSTAVDTGASITQMSGERLPPPSEVPKELVTIALPTETPAEPLPKPSHFEAERPSTLDKTSCSHTEPDNSRCICFTCLISGNERKTKQCCHSGCSLSDINDCECDSYCTKCVFDYHVPDMVGSNVWFAGYNAGEHFNADARNRIWAEYRHWNNADLLGGEGIGVERFSFGLEKQLWKKNSVELRVPLFYFGSAQTTAVELGNISVLLKQVLQQNSRWTVSAGGGAALPSATSESFLVNTGTGLLNNNTYLVSFLGVQWHPNKSTFGHFLVQADVPFVDSELMFNRHAFRTGIQLGRWIYRADHGKRACRFGGFAEVNFAEVHSTGGYPGKSTLTATAGMPMVFGKLTCTNSLTLPMMGNDRPFSVGYSFSLTRQF